MPAPTFLESKRCGRKWDNFQEGRWFVLKGLERTIGQ
jgi:hypothetical protein